MTDTEQAVVNGFVVVVAHLFEQQKHLLSYQTLVDPPEPRSKHREEKFEALLADRGVDASRFSGQATLEELRAAADTIKHGDGWSARELKKLRPELFVPPSLRGDSFLGSPGDTLLQGPLMGAGVFVEPRDLDSYFDAVEEFWRFVLDECSAQALE